MGEPPSFGAVIETDKVLGVGPSLTEMLDGLTGTVAACANGTP